MSGGGLLFPYGPKKGTAFIARVLKSKGILHSYLLCFSLHSIAKKATNTFLRFLYIMSPLDTLTTSAQTKR